MLDSIALSSMLFSVVVCDIPAKNSWFPEHSRNIFVVVIVVLLRLRFNITLHKIVLIFVMRESLGNFLPIFVLMGLLCDITRTFS